MKQIILYAVVSIDGRIAVPDGNTELLSDCLSDEYRNFLNTVDTVIMGGRTYREMMCRDIIWPFAGQMTYVISHCDWGTKENIKFITEDATATIGELRRGEGKNICLVGDGEAVSMLLAENLIDEMRIIYIPLVLGRGAMLFPEQPCESQWELAASKKYDNGILGVTYRRKDFEYEYGEDGYICDRRNLL